MKNIYDGVVVLDQRGEAVVSLPEWFGALNTDCRYQLTCLGGYAPVYIASEITKNQFTIAGGQAGLKVCWQITGVRQDRWAQQHRIPVEVEKPSEQRGLYHYPELYGQPVERGIHQRLIPINLPYDLFPVLESMSRALLCPGSTLRHRKRWIDPWDGFCEAFYVYKLTCRVRNVATSASG